MLLSTMSSGLYTLEMVYTVLPLLRISPSCFRAPIRVLCDVGHTSFLIRFGVLVPATGGRAKNIGS